MKWNDQLRIGIPVIDSQHKRLINMVVDLNHSVRQGLRGRVLHEALDMVYQYTVRHFQLEEKYMEESAYPKLDEQKQAHARFTERLRDLKEQLIQHGLTPAMVIEIREELNRWIKAHVIGMDMEFGEHYRQQRKDA